MTSAYPGAIDNFTNPSSGDTLDSATVPHATQHANANDAIEAIETELGVNASGSYATVAARFDANDATDTLKAPIASPTFTGTVTIPTGAAITGYLTTATAASTYAPLASPALTGTATAVNLGVSGYITRTAPVTATANYTVTATDTYIINNKTGSSLTVTLPTASTQTGREITIKTIQAFTVISASSNVVPAASATAGTAILAATAGKFARLVSDGTNWVIMDNN
jgi:hypothetical protein